MYWVPSTVHVTKQDPCLSCSPLCPRWEHCTAHCRHSVRICWIHQWTYSSKKNREVFSHIKLVSRVRESQSLCPQINILSILTYMALWRWKWKQVTLVLPQFTSQLCHLPALQNWARCLTSFCFSFFTSKIGIIRVPTSKVDMRVNHACLIMSAHNKHFLCV